MLGIKDTGILLATFVMKADHGPQDTGVLDAIMRDGLLTFVDHTSRTVA